MKRQDFIYSIAELYKYLQEKGFDMEKVWLSSSAHSFKLIIPKYYVNLIDWYNPNDPLAKMVVTSVKEESIKKYELADPIGDKSHSPVPGIVHRYPDRCLLMLTNSCAVHCRFCFRKNVLSTNSASYEQSMQYIESHKELWEVILSGGDPFTLTDFFLEKVITRIKTIEHVKVIRFHTRTPAVYPARVTDDLVTVLKKAKRSVVVVHINHPREVTKDFIQAIHKLRESGTMLLSQTVLMKDVNNSVGILAELFKRLVEIGIKPYYLHHPDLAAGTHHFRISVEECKKIVQKLRGNISGVCLPEYVIDTPGGYGKIPVFWFQHTGKNEYTATSFEGITIVYKDPY